MRKKIGIFFTIASTALFLHILHRKGEMERDISFSKVSQVAPYSNWNIPLKTK
jgi:hypothetical protein